MTCLAIEKLQFRWPGQTAPCLSIPDFSLAAGERVFLHGPSGSGKSTLLGLIAGLQTPQSGTIQLQNQCISQMSGAARDQVRADQLGIIFQQFNLIPYLSLIDNVLLPCRFSKRRSAAALTSDQSLEAAATRLLNALDLTSHHLPVSKLSVGQQQRVAAARALIGNPALIIADEPTSALDASHQTAFLDLLQHVCAEAGSALLFVSHDDRLANRFDRTVSLAEINQVAGDAGWD